MLALFDALGDLDLFLAGQQRYGAHLLQVHAHRVVDLAVQIFALSLRLAIGRFAFALFALGNRHFTTGIDDLNIHLAEHQHQLVDLIRGHHLRRQNIIDFIIGEKALYLADIDQLFDLFYFGLASHPRFSLSVWGKTSVRCRTALWSSTSCW